MKHTHTTPTGEEITFDLHEVHYNEEGKIVLWTVDPILSGYEDVDDLISALEYMLSDAKKSKDDILDYDTLQPEADFDYEKEEDEAGKV
jgi:hypothetical protein